MDCVIAFIDFLKESQGNDHLTIKSFHYHRYITNKPLVRHLIESFHKIKTEKKDSVYRCIPQSTDPYLHFSSLSFIISPH